MDFSDELIEELLDAVRVKGTERSKAEIEALAQACVLDMRIAGAYRQAEDDALYKQALKLYTKAHYGYDKDTERFTFAYEKLRDAMALSGDYPEGGGA